MKRIRYFVTVVMIFFIIFFSFGCKSNRNVIKMNSLKDSNINGNVRTIISIIYGSKTENGIIVGGDLTDYITVVDEYNEDGMSTSQVIYDANKNIIDETCWIYNEDNLLLRVEFSNYDIHGCTKIECKYNEYAELIRTDFFDKEFRIFQSVITTYYSSGHEHMNYFLDENEEETYIYEFIYDDNNVLVESSGYDAVNNHKSKHTYDYDNNGNKIFEKWVDEKGNIEMIYEWEYDKYNNLLKYTWSDGKHVFTSEKYEYSYDNLDNWVEKSVFNKENEKVQHIVREIEYY